MGFAVQCGSCGDFSPIIHFGAPFNIFSVGDVVSSGELHLSLALGATFDAVGATGNVYSGVFGTPQLIGTWEIVASADASAVPIPPAVALFATGLAGLGLLARRRKKQAFVR